MSTDEHNNASINLDTSELKELEGLKNEGEIDQETLNLKLLDKSQSDDVSNKSLKTQKLLKRLKDNKIITIMATIIGRITNQGTLNRKKKLVQSYHACNKNTLKSSDKRIINSLSCVRFRTKIYYLYYFSLIYVYMFIVRVSFHILHKNHKQESQKTYNCIP